MRLRRVLFGVVTILASHESARTTTLSADPIKLELIDIEPEPHGLRIIMFSKHLPRLFVIKFLGLFSTTPLKETPDDVQQQKDETRVAKEDAPDSYKVPKHFSSKHIAELMLIKGIPGLTISVAKNGQTVWNSAFGFCDVENQLECTPEARMRIASISKPMFVSSVIAPMIEDSKLNISSSVHKYLSTDEFPKQEFRDKQRDITVEQLLSHTSGIKHYIEFSPADESLRPIGSSGSQKIYQCDDQYNRVGFYQRSTFRSVIEALQPFKAGPLDKEPGEYNYTTYGYTLLSAVAQKVHQQTAPDEASRREQIEDYWIKVLRRDWKLTETNLDQDEPILSNRARYYMRSSPKGGLINAPYVDNSVKWAGGGLISTVKDLAKFGVQLIDSYKERESSILKRTTLELLWTERKKSYCLGFHAQQLNPNESSGEKRAIYHSGGAVGASSILIIYPESEVVVAILTNLANVNLKDTGFKIANLFAQKHGSD